MKRFRIWLRKWWECRSKSCTYYQHYLAYGGPDLTHEGFHAAEERCEYWQRRDMDWMKEHEVHTEWGVEYTGGESPFRHICETWEKRVRA